jgi:hypothetical protein
MRGGCGCLGGELDRSSVPASACLARALRCTLVKVPIHDPRPRRSMRHAPRGRNLHIIKCLTYKKINSGPTKSQNESILSTYLKVLLLGQRHLSCTIFLEGLFLDGPIVVDVGLESRLVNHVTDVLLTGSVCHPIRHLLSTVF